MTEFLFLGIDKKGKQVALYKTSEQAFKNPKVNECRVWNFHEKTGQYYPSNSSIGKLELVPKKEQL